MFAEMLLKRNINQPKGTFLPLKARNYPRLKQQECMKYGLHTLIKWGTLICCFQSAPPPHQEYQALSYSFTYNYLAVLSAWSPLSLIISGLDSNITLSERPFLTGVMKDAPCPWRTHIALSLFVCPRPQAANCMIAESYKTKPFLAHGKHSVMIFNPIV